MQDYVDPLSGQASTDVIVRQFRQVLLYPLQLLPMPGAAQTEANWERLMALDCAWHDAGDEAAGDMAYIERHYSEFVSFMPDVQRFLYGEDRRAAGASGYGVSPIRVFRRNDVVKAEVRLPSGEPTIVLRGGLAKLDSVISGFSA